MGTAEPSCICGHPKSLHRNNGGPCTGYITKPMRVPCGCEKYSPQREKIHPTRPFDSYEHPVTCPYCGRDVLFTSLMEVLIAARRACPQCKREMLLSDGRALKLSVDTTKKQPKQVHSHISKAQGRSGR